MQADQKDFRKKIYRSRYVLAFLFTVVIFALGIFVGMYFKELRSETLTQNLVDQQVSYKDVLMQYQLTEQAVTQNDCNTLQIVFRASLKELQKNLEFINQYENNNQIKQSDYLKLRHGYTLSQVEYWLLAQNINQVCTKNATVILYFFDEATKCPDCENQGIHLDYVKKKVGDSVLIFAIDQRETGVVEILKAKYNVTSYPTLIVDGNKTGYLTTDDIYKIICDSDPTVSGCDAYTSMSDNEYIAES